MAIVRLTAQKKIDDTQSETDSVVKVIYVQPEHNAHTATFLLNGKPVSLSTLLTLNPAVIKDVEVKKGDGGTENNKARGQILITTKSDYHPKLVSLSELKSKYIDSMDGPAIFMLNDKILKGSYDDFFVDENYLLNIVVDNVDINNGDLNVVVIKLFTKTKENIERSKETRLKGDS